MSALDLPPPPWIVAHRGASGDSLENTLESCALAVAAGAPMIEVDVQLAADGVPVVVHDWDLRRLAGDRRTVERLTAAELQELELRLQAADRPLRSGRPVAAAALRGAAPTLAQLLGAMPAGQPLNLELKRRQADRRRFAQALLAGLGDREQVLVSSFDLELLSEVREAAPRLPLSPLESRRPERLLAAGDRLGAWGLHCHRRLANRALAEAAAAAGRPLLAYTVNDIGEAKRLFAAGIAGIFSDWAAELMAELAGPPAAAR